MIDLIRPQGPATLIQGREQLAAELKLKIFAYGFVVARMRSIA